MSAFGSRRRLIYVGLIVSLLLAWAFTPLSAWLAAQLVAATSLQSDIELGRRAAEQFRGQILSDGGLQAIGEELLRGMRPQLPNLGAYSWQFYLLNDNSVNAFACPGGFIFVNRGLRDIATRDELAAVLGHEIGHVLHRHSQQRMVQSRLSNILLEAVLVGDGDDVNEGLGGELAGILLRGADTLLSLSYSRANEYEADAVAWWASLSAGYAPEAAVSFFKKLGDGNAARWLSTHPATADRIIALEGKSQELLKLRHGPRRVDLAAHFTPALVGEASGVRGVLAKLFSALPQYVTKKALVAGLTVLAAFVDELLGSTPGTSADDATSTWDPARDCEDGESKISFEPVRRGQYVALGHGKCLTVEDLRGLQRSGRLSVNPYTRQPFTQEQKRRIGALLR